MIISLEVSNPQGALLNLPFDDESGSFFVESIEGLEPVKATLVSSGFAQLDGAQYQSSRREPRNIKIRLGLEPADTESVQDLRDRLYEFFMPKTQANLKFRLSGGTGASRDISGRIEEFLAPLFVKEPAADISLMCFDPDFYDPVSVVVEGATTDLQTPFVVAYPGTVETGFVFNLTVNRTLSAFTIYHTSPDGILNSIDFTYPLLAGDVLTISTAQGAKSIMLKRGNADSSVLYGMSAQSNWLELQQGDNSFRVYAVGAAVPFTMTYVAKYGGL